MNNIMKLKRAVNNRRATGTTYFAPMNNLTWDFWSQDDHVKVAAVYRSRFLHAFLLAVCEQSASQNGEEAYYYPRIADAVCDPEYAVDVFDCVLCDLVPPAMPGRKQVTKWFREVCKHR